MIGILALAAGSVLGYLARQSIAKKQLGTAEGKINKMTQEAEEQARTVLLEAKNKAVEVLDDVKKDEKKRQEQIFRVEKRLETREENLDRKMDELEKEKRNLISKADGRLQNWFCWATQCENSSMLAATRLPAEPTVE